MSKPWQDADEEARMLEAIVVTLCPLTTRTMLSAISNHLIEQCSNPLTVAPISPGLNYKCSVDWGSYESNEAISHALGATSHPTLYSRSFLLIKSLRWRHLSFCSYRWKSGDWYTTNIFLMVTACVEYQLHTKFQQGLWRKTMPL